MITNNDIAPTLTVKYLLPSTDTGPFNELTWQRAATNVVEITVRPAVQLGAGNYVVSETAGINTTVLSDHIAAIGGDCAPPLAVHHLH